MKKSDLKLYIREEIIEILSEVDTDKARGTAVLPKTTNPTDIKKLTDQGVDVELKEELDDDIEPSMSDINPKDSVAKLASQLADVTKEMKSTVNKWKKSEGVEKDALLARLKKLTAIKKELEALTTSTDDIEDEEM